MSLLKRLKIISVISAIMSIVLYCVVLFQPFGLLEFQDILFVLYPAQMLLILTIVFVVCLIILKKTNMDTAKIQKSCICVVAILLSGCIVLCGYSYLACYNFYSPEKLFENDTDYIQSFYPYHNVEEYSKDENEPIELSVSYIPGTNYVYLYCYDTFISDSECDYEVEYIKSVSPFMRLKFLLERLVPNALNITEIDVMAYGEIKKVDQVSFIAYVDEDDYAVLFSRGGRCIYASLLDAPKNVMVEDFAKEIINQTDLLDNATKEKVFLDVPLIAVHRTQGDG